MSVWDSMVTGPVRVSCPVFCIRETGTKKPWRVVSEVYVVASPTDSTIRVAGGDSEVHARPSNAPAHRRALRWAEEITWEGAHIPTFERVKFGNKRSRCVPVSHDYDIRTTLYR